MISLNLCFPVFANINRIMVVLRKFKEKMKLQKNFTVTVKKSLYAMEIGKNSLNSVPLNDMNQPIKRNKHNVILYISIS